MANCPGARCKPLRRDLFNRKNVELAGAQDGGIVRPMMDPNLATVAGANEVIMTKIRHLAGKFRQAAPFS